MDFFRSPLPVGTSSSVVHVSSFLTSPASSVLSVPAAVLLPACACVSGCAGLIGASETTRGNDGGMRSKAVDGTIFHAPWRCLESVVAGFFYIYTSC